MSAPFAKEFDGAIGHREHKERGHNREPGEEVAGNKVVNGKLVLRQKDVGHAG